MRRPPSERAQEGERREAPLTGRVSFCLFLATAEADGDARASISSAEEERDRRRFEVPGIPVSLRESGVCIGVPGFSSIRRIGVTGTSGVSDAPGGGVACAREGVAGCRARAALMPSGRSVAGKMREGEFARSSSIPGGTW